jgi:hypothetical protein
MVLPSDPFAGEKMKKKKKIEMVTVARTHRVGVANGQKVLERNLRFQTCSSTAVPL